MQEWSCRFEIYKTNDCLKLKRTRGFDNEIWLHNPLQASKLYLNTPGRIKALTWQAEEYPKLQLPIRKYRAWGMISITVIDSSMIKPPVLGDCEKDM